MRILVIVAHPDDEVLGSGATIRRHDEQGDQVFSISLSNGVGARGDDSQAALARREAAERAAEVLGFEWAAHGDFPDNAIDSVPLLEIVQFVESAKEKVGPDLVYTHHGGDLNVDHRAAFQATLTAFRPQPEEQVSEIRTFEVVSSTEWSDQNIGESFDPNLFVDASEYWEAKVTALNEYESEMRDHPHVRSYDAIEALATRRGTQVGLPKAEAFETIRRIIR